MTAEPLPCDIDELRTLFLFEKLDRRAAELAVRARARRAARARAWCTPRATRPPASSSCSTARSRCRRRVGAEDVEVEPDRPARRVRRRLVRPTSATACRRPTCNSMRAITPSPVLRAVRRRLRRADARVVPDGGAPARGAVLRQPEARRARSAQRERLLALGSLSAGLTHELNNPAAAAVRATSSLRERVAGMRHKLAMIAGGTLGPQPARDADRAAGAGRRAGRPRRRSCPRWRPPTARTSWPTGSTTTGSRSALRHARRPSCRPASTWTGWTRSTAIVDDGMLEGALRWLNYTLETELLMNEIEDSATRISTLVGAAKQYSQLDRAPYQVLDVHELLDSTLMMLSRKIGDGHGGQGLRPVAAGDPGLRGRAEPGVDEPDRQRAAGHGRHRHADDPHRPGRRLGAWSRSATPARASPTAIVGRIFEPFFTTKPVGEGTGLGLDISWRIVVNKHHGDLSVQSEPGDTRFRVRLPSLREEAYRHDRTDVDPVRRPQRHRLRRVRRGRRLVGAPAPLRRSAGTSAAATRRRPSTPARTPGPAGIRSCRASSRARSGSGTTRARTTTTARAWPIRSTTRSTRPCPGRPTGCRPTGAPHPLTRRAPSPGTRSGRARAGCCRARRVRAGRRPGPRPAPSG